MTEMGRERGRYTIKALQEDPLLQPLSYGEAQLRMKRMAEANPSWASKSGKRGAWAASEAGRKVLIRIRELERTGVSLDTAITLIQADQSFLLTTVETGKQFASRERTPETSLEMGDRWVHDEMVSLLKAQVDDLRSERDRLLTLVERNAGGGSKARRE